MMEVDMKRGRIVSSEDFHDRHAKTYDSDYDDVPYWEMYDDLTWDNMLRFLPRSKKARILDAGGGTGRWTVRIAELGYEVTLTDISEKMLEIAERKIKDRQLDSNVTIKKLDICAMGELEDNYFDLAISEGDPLSYCDSPRKATEELHRVLKKGGHAIGSVDNRMSPSKKYIVSGDFGKAKKLLENGEYIQEDSKAGLGFRVHMFHPQELRKMFQDCGFKIERLFGKMIIPWPWIEKLASTQEGYKKALKAQIEFSEMEELFPYAGHLGIVGKKIRNTR